MPRANANPKSNLKRLRPGADSAASNPGSANLSRRVAGEWKLQDAKSRFSELFRKTRSDGPQRVTRHGSDAVIVVSEEEWNQGREGTSAGPELAGESIAAIPARQRPRRGESTLQDRQESLWDFFRRSPMAGVDLQLTRDPDSGRDFEL